MNPIQKLEVESLEDRMMLSTVQIYAAGGSGQETLALRVDDQVVAEFTNVGGDASAREYIELEFETDQTITGGQVRIDFTNDAFDAATGLDRNLFIDRIVIDGVTHQTEGPSVFHTGLYENGGVSGPGFLATETLNINGSIFFSDDNSERPPSDGRQITFVARGTTGDEIVSLIVDGETVESFQLSQVNQQYQFNTDQELTADQVQFSFDNDVFDPENGVDRNVVLEFLEIENLANNQTSRFNGDSSDVFSTGTFTPDDGVTPGFGRGNTLHSNGVFSFEGEPSDSGSDSDSGSIIRFTSAGTTGSEIVQVLVGDEVVFETVLVEGRNGLVGPTRGEYQVVLENQNVDLNDVRLAFVNDGLDEAGEDRDVSVDYVYVRDIATGEVQRTTAADESTFSTGSFVDGTLESGFGRGITLHTNGFFQFSNSSRIIVRAAGATGAERFQVIANDEVLAEFGVDEATTFEWGSRLLGFIVDTPQAVDIEDIRIQFINDGINADGGDRDLNVREVVLDGRTYDIDTTVVSAAAFDENPFAFGFGTVTLLSLIHI